MDDQTLLILALALLAVAGLTVSVSGWILFARGRKADAPADAPADEAPEEPSEGSTEGEASS